MSEIKVLDHGFVRFVEDWGRGDAEMPEAGIIEAARQSTQGSFRGWESDEKLLRFLFCNKPPHATPFEFAGMVIDVYDPTCVVWEWVRHRTLPQSDEFPGDVAFNVMSSRYGEIPEKDYRPSVDRCLVVSTSNKQAGSLPGSANITRESAEEWLQELDEFYRLSQRVYRSGLDRGVPKELARLALSFGRYWSMRVTGNLRNWLAFLTLRADPGAQWEIRMYAEAVGQIIAERFPRTWALYCGAKGPVPA